MEEYEDPSTDPEKNIEKTKGLMGFILPALRRIRESLLTAFKSKNKNNDDPEKED